MLVLAIIIASAMGKPPSAVHDPAGYKGFQGCMSVLTIAFFGGILLMIVKGCN